MMLSYFTDIFQSIVRFFIAASFFKKIFGISFAYFKLIVDYTFVFRERKGLLNYSIEK